MRMFRIVTSLAALAVVLGGCGRVEREAAAPERDPAPDSTLVWIEEGASFIWPRLGHADMYRLELYDARGELLGGGATRDTAIPAAAVTPDTARAGSWRVVPVSAGGSELPVVRSGSFRRR